MSKKWTKERGYNKQFKRDKIKFNKKDLKVRKEIAMEYLREDNKSIGKMG